MIGRRSESVKQLAHQVAAAVVEPLDLGGVIHCVVGRVLHPDSGVIHCVVGRVLHPDSATSPLCHRLRVAGNGPRNEGLRLAGVGKP
jgi:hypothetical protein